MLFSLFYYLFYRYCYLNYQILLFFRISPRCSCVCKKCKCESCEHKTETKSINNLHCGSNMSGVKRQSNPVLGGYGSEPTVELPKVADIPKKRPSCLGGLVFQDGSVVTLAILMKGIFSHNTFLHHKIYQESRCPT